MADDVAFASVPAPSPAPTTSDGGDGGDGGALRCYAGWKQYREGSDAFLAGQWQQDPQSEIVTCEKNETHCVLLEYAWPFAGGGYGFSQGRKRVIQRRFNVGVLEVVPNRKASTL